jgi:hypothetical protein
LRLGVTFVTVRDLDDCSEYRHGLAVTTERAARNGYLGEQTSADACRKDA